jgi:6-pyruvoyltetrahydropterin/6-carboxytetrahydropterin synthase
MNLKGISDKLILLPYQPTCENMLIDFADRIRKSFPEGVKLHSMRLRETASSYAEWFAEDNPV